ncbi:MAG: hypothetical protein CR975_03940 [Gammaproteobacteria bacterium]|nr:MAG: hypothetical protein CR975_03940 [Gammaproteobacteria bacterium]
MKSPPDALQAIRQRRTLKVLSQAPLPVKPRDENLIHTLIESAYYAPFHYPCHQQYRQDKVSPLPWRFYVLDSQACRRLRDSLQQAGKKMGKIALMLNSADYLMQVTWCPQPQPQADSDALFAGHLVNMEHIAASGAAIQNVLLTATALGYENYWSSGGVLRETFTYEQLSIESAEILLAALFIFPNQAETPATTEYLPSRRRQRGEISNCYRFIDL